MGLVHEGDLVDLHKSEGHGFIFNYNVDVSIYGIKNRPFQFNVDITIEDEEKRMRTAVKFSECVRCRYLENNKNPHGCFDRPKVITA